jgi:hypothetical protein
VTATVRAGPAPDAGRRPFLAAAAVWPLLVAAFHWRAARPGMAFAGPDLRHFFFAVREATAAALREGGLPGWQRGTFMGYPLHADPQAAVLDPATWLTLPWDAPRALALGALLHLAVAGWGMLWWARRRGLGAAEGLLAAVLFALGAKQTVHLQHWNFAASAAWWPWMLAGLEGFRATGRGRHLLLTSAASALSWLGGSAQMAYLGTLVAAAFALAAAPDLWRRRPADAALGLAAAPLGLLLAGPVVLPALELARLGPRGAGVDYAFATSWKWPDRSGLALFLLPRAFGGDWIRDEMNLWEATGYLGVLPLGLAAAAPLRRRGNLLFLALGAAGVWLSFGEDAWLGLHRLLFHALPGFGTFRNPTRTLMVTSFASALLSGEALAALRAPGGRRRALRAGAALCAAGALAPVLPRLGWFTLDRAAGREGAVVAAALALAGIAWLALRAAALRREGTGRAWALAAAAACFADLHLACGTWNEVAPAAGEGPALAGVVPLLPAPPAPRRLAVVAKWGRTSNAPARLGLEAATGYGPTCIDRVRRLLEATATGRLEPAAPLRSDANFPRPDPASPLWPLLATPLVVSDRPLLLPPLAAVAPEWELPTAAYAAAALPRVFFTASWEVRPDEGLGDSLRRAARGEVAILAEAPPGLPPPGPPAPPRAAAEVRVRRDALEAVLDAPAPGLAVVVDPWFPGWRAEVDGRPAPLLRANLAFQAVPVGPGRHLIRLSWRSDTLGPGALAAAASLLGLLAALAWRRRTAPRFPRGV